MAARSRANLFLSRLQFSNSCPVSLQYRHVKLLSRDPSTPANGLGGLGIPINLLHFQFYWAAFSCHPHTDKTWPEIWQLPTAVGLPQWLVQLLNFQFPASVFLSVLSGL